VAAPHSNLDMACAAETVASKLLPALGTEFSWMIRSVHEKSKPMKPNITRAESKALNSLKHNKEIMILQADKGNCTVILDKSTCKEKLTTLVNSGVNEPWQKVLYLKWREWCRDFSTNINKLFPLILNLN
jgi:hypothetical protein